MGTQRRVDQARVAGGATPFTAEAFQALVEAGRLAHLRKQCPQPTDLLHGLLIHKESAVGKALDEGPHLAIREAAADPSASIEQAFREETKTAFTDAVARAEVAATRELSPQTETFHLLESLLAAPESPSRVFLERFGVDPQRLISRARSLRDPVPPRQQCPVCDFSSCDPLLFVRVTTRSGQTVVCLECRRERRYGRALLSAGVACLLVAVGAGLVLTHSSPGWVLINVGLLSVYAQAMCILHELGHAAIGYLVGFEVVGVVIGDGATVASRLIFGVAVIARMPVLGGRTFFVPRSAKGYRWRAALVMSGGILVHLLVISVILWRHPIWQIRHMSWFDGWQPLPGLLCINLLLLLGSLWLAPPPDVDSVTDGWQLLTVGRVSESAIEEAVSSLERVRMEVYQMAGSLDRLRRLVDARARRTPRSLMESAAESIFTERYEQALAGLDRFVNESGQLAPHVRAIIDASRASVCLMCGDSARADELSASALRVTPTEIHALGTRGAVLIETGRVEEGLPLVRMAYARRADADHRASNACFLALGEFKRGNIAEARLQLEAAEMLCPDLTLMAWVRARMDGKAPVADKPSAEARGG